MAAKEIGNAYSENTLSYTEHKLAHAITGAATAKLAGVDTTSAALGAAGAEVVGEKAFEMGVGTDAAVKLAKVGGASAGLLTGNVEVAANSAEIAADNNLAQMLVGALAYTLLTGEGNPMEGVRKIGSGDHMIGRGIEKAMEKGVEISYEKYPKETDLVLTKLSQMGDKVDAVVKYADEKTGKVVSTKWNKISKADQNFLKGSVKILAVVIPAAKNTSIPNVKKGSDKVYDSLKTREFLEAKHGAGNLTSTTAPPKNAPNVKLAGKRHPVTGIVFDKKGFPIFDDIAKFDTRIPVDIAISGSRRMHFKESTKQLKQAIEKGQVSKKQFSNEQLRQIMNNKAQIEGFTWHHHQDTGRMQLVPDMIHEKTAHIGGYTIKEGK